MVVDTSIALRARPKVKAGFAKPPYVDAPIPGMVTAIHATLCEVANHQVFGEPPA